MSDDAVDAFERPAHATAARQALAAARPDGTVVDSTVLGRGNRKRTVVVRFRKRPPVVVQSSGASAALRSEAALLEAIRDRTAVPVPPVLAVAAVDGVVSLVTPRLDGADFHERFVALDPAVRRRVARSLGRYLAALHEAFSFDGYGRLTADSDSLSVDGEASWPEWLAAYGRAAVDRLPAVFDSVRPGLESLLSERPPRTEPTARLFPWDFRPGNALVADGEVTALLDWEAPLAAGPALSVAKAEYLVADWYVDDPAPLRSAFVDGYGAVRAYPEPAPVHRAVAIADSAVDSTGEVTRPGYPECGVEEATAFHRRALAALL
ncbi:phosphotransferase family protein [Natronomonas marina]|jgi:aminoglycoside phosphotransferase (APT) family kinase protein|uniref:phosphotransferase family protein n=1 Tax=Natronomonas marina TaxID=2961939 RepID=UPI0020C98CD5|nr:phosphotransferase [Natronomonas marina]